MSYIRKDKCDDFLKNLHRAGAIDDSMLFHVTGLKEREQKYHKCSGNSAKCFSDLVIAYAYPLFKTHNSFCCMKQFNFSIQCSTKSSNIVAKII